MNTLSMRDEKEPMYTVPAACSNCGYKGYIEEEKGVKAEGAYQCPHCKCMTFTRAWGKTR